MIIVNGRYSLSAMYLRLSKALFVPYQGRPWFAHIFAIWVVDEIGRASTTQILDAPNPLRQT